MFLKEFRKKNEMNQKEMAKELEVSTLYYSKTESGYRMPSFEFVLKLKIKWIMMRWFWRFVYWKQCGLISRGMLTN